MKRTALFAVVGAAFVLAANCSQDKTSSPGPGAGGSRAAGGSSSPTATGGTGGGGGSEASGGTSSSGGARDEGGAGGATGADGSGGASAPRGRGGRATGTGGAEGGATGTTGARTGGATGTGGGTSGGGASGTAPSAGCGQAAGLESGRASIDVSGKTREYILALPSNYDENKPYRLVFGWHPWGGSAQQVASSRYFGLQSEAGNEAIFVAGEGQDYQGQGLGWANTGGEDVDFALAMMERFRSQLCIDENRIFSTGFSFGAMFSFSLGCESDSMMRAIAPMAGNATTSGRCATGAQPVAVMAMIGVDDSLLSGHRQAVQTYAKRNGCTTETAPAEPDWCDGLNQDKLPCTCVSYQGCKEGYPVVECEYKAGHQPAPNPGPIWDFFAQF